MCPGYHGIIPDYLCSVCQQPCTKIPHHQDEYCKTCDVHHLVRRNHQEKDPTKPWYVAFLIKYEFLDDPFFKDAMLSTDPDRSITVVSFKTDKPINFFSIPANHIGKSKEELLNIIYTIDREERFK